MSLFHAGLQPALDANGNPISGATWNFYLTGTTTPTNVYSNNSLSVSLGSTVTADAAGRFAVIFLDDDVTYRAILKDAGGATIKDIDPVNGESASTAFPRISAAVAGVTTDQAGTINAELAEADVTELVLPEGIIWTSTQISIPTGKRLRGRGREKTILKALSTFDTTVGAAVVKTAVGAIGVHISDLTVDANKVGLGQGSALRRNGILMAAATYFSIKRVNVKNCTGYNFFISGDDNGAEAWGDMAEYGLVEDCYTENGQEHYETLYSRFITFRNCHAANGDGDITCLGWFHPYAGSTDIIYDGCTAYGAGAVEVSPTTGPDGGGTNPHPIERVTFLNCEIHNTTTTTAFITTDAVGNTYDLEIINTNISSTGGIGLSLNDTTCRMIGGSVEGVSECVHLDNSTFEFIGTHFTGTNSGTGTAFGITLASSSILRGTGGSITAAASGTGGETPVSGSTGALVNVRMSPANSSVSMDAYDRTPVVPSFADFTWLNQGTSTAEQAFHGLVMLPQQDHALHGLEQAVPTGDFSIRARMDQFLADNGGVNTDTTYIHFGPYFRDAAGKVVQACIGIVRDGSGTAAAGAQYLLRKWTDTATISSTTEYRLLEVPKWVILARVGGNIQMYGSHNGHDLQAALFSEAQGAFLGAITHIGWGVRAHPNNDSTRAFLQSFEVAAA